MGKNETIQSGIKKIAITVLTQGIILALGVITGFILPKKMGAEMYGYWNTYLFYLNYLNLFGLGFNDGIALFYSSYDYHEFPFERQRSAICVFLIYLAIVTVLIFLGVSLVHNDMYRGIYQLQALSIPLVCLQCVILTIYLSSNRTGVYNGINLVTKVLATVAYVGLLLAGITAARPMMYADFFVRLLMTISCIVLGRQLFFGKASNIRQGMSELTEKSKYGFHITMGILASSFVPVMGRIIIEWSEPTSVLGVYAFGLGLLSYIILFTNTAGTVFFPLLKRLPEDKLPDYFTPFSLLSSGLIDVALLAYIPFLLIVQIYMKEYIPVLSYLPFLFAMCLPLGKMQLLLTPYYKALRLERAFFAANGAGVIGMLAFTALAYRIFHSVMAVAVCSAIVLTLWMILTEAYLVKRMDIHFSRRSTITDIVMMVCFVAAGWHQSALYFTTIYGACLILYILFYRKKYTILLRQYSKKRNALNS